jgi:hypothetical protein
MMEANGHFNELAVAMRTPFSFFRHLFSSKIICNRLLEHAKAEQM